MHKDETFIPGHLVSDFLTWLWWGAETGAKFQGKTLTVSTRLSFRAPDVMRVVSMFSSDNPSGKDAKTALMEAKPMEEIRLNLTVGSDAYEFTLKGELLEVTGAKLSLPAGNDDIQAVLRMESMMSLDEQLAGLLQEFSEIRSNELQWKNVHREISGWASDL